MKKTFFLVLLKLIILSISFLGAQGNFVDNYLESMSLLREAQNKGIINEWKWSVSSDGDAIESVFVGISSSLSTPKEKLTELEESLSLLNIERIYINYHVRFELKNFDVLLNKPTPGPPLDPYWRLKQELATYFPETYRLINIQSENSTIIFTFPLNYDFNDKSEIESILEQFLLDHGASILK